VGVRFPPRAPASAASQLRLAGWLIGWVERSETHHPSQHDNAAEAMGFTSFYSSYALTRKFNSTLAVASIRRETLLSATRVDPCQHLDHIGRRTIASTSCGLRPISCNARQSSRRSSVRSFCVGQQQEAQRARSLLQNTACARNRDTFVCYASPTRACASCRLWPCIVILIARVASIIFPTHNGSDPQFLKAAVAAQIV
jgi:hypothetical protein